MNCRSWIVVAVGALLFGCVENKPYRLGGIKGAEEHYSGQENCFEKVQVSRERDFRISFIEFDERGDFWDRRQLRKTAEVIEAPNQKPTLLVIYIHGWHHNAKDRPPGGKNPGDVQTFRCLLSELAISGSTKNYQVHGVYLGWRGRLIEGPLDYFTFLDRKAAATRVAGMPVTETILELIRQARKNESSKCVVIGHSFGALLLEKAMLQAMTARIIGKPQPKEKGEPFQPVADLILLINSAAESLYAKEMTDMFNRIGYRDKQNAKKPILISITSKGDTATGGWFPVGTFFPNLFAHRKYHWGHEVDKASDETDQNIYLTKTPGHNKLLFTHSIDDKLDKTTPVVSVGAIAAGLPVRFPEASCPEKEEPSNPAFEYNLQHVSDDWIFATSLKNNPDQFKWWQVHPKEENKRTPYWILQVPKAIIPNHAPIFTPEGRAMMAALFKIANPTKEKRSVEINAEAN